MKAMVEGLTGDQVETPVSGRTGQNEAFLETHPTRAREGDFAKTDDSVRFVQRFYS